MTNKKIEEIKLRELKKGNLNILSVDFSFLKPLEIDRILHECEVVTGGKIFAKNRKKKNVYCRQLAHYVLYHFKNQLNITVEGIAKSTGLSNHATVLHSLKQLNNWISYDKKVLKDLEILKEKFGF